MSSIQKLLAGYRSGELNAATVFETAVSLARAGKSDGNNEWIYVITPEEQSAQLAKLSDIDAPLYGIPFAVKDNIDVEGVPTTAACPEFAYTATTNAICVQRLLDAGALFVGKTNLDQFATGLVGTRSPYGAVPSTISAKHVGGGSSSGSATVVSRGVVPFSLGTDTAGSGRVPAAFNGVIGLKPTVGRVSTQGVLPACRSLDCVSVFTRTAGDASLVLSILESEPEDGTDVRFVPPSYGPKNFPAKLRVGVPSELVKWTTPEIRKAFDNAVSALRDDGTEIVDVDFTPLLDIGGMLYGGAWLAERYIPMEKMLREKASAVDVTVRKLVAPGADVSGADAFRGVHKLAGLRGTAQKIWNKVDVLLTPAVPRHPTFEQVKKAPVEANAQLGAYTTFVNLLGWCALVTPCGPPFALSWIAPAGADAALLALACGAPKVPESVVPMSVRGEMTQLKVEETMRLAVVGAHLQGMPLHHELERVRATLVKKTRTAGKYRLYALMASIPAKPALVRVEWRGRGIEIEVYEVPVSEMGIFLRGIPHPLGLGRVETEDGEWVTGFIAEQCAIKGAKDVTKYRGWRAYIAARGEDRSIHAVSMASAVLAAVIAFGAVLIRGARNGLTN